MKYQSELINEILEVRGHEKSSLHYESECIESWIEEVEGAYPKLCDYEGEWLNYMVENPIGSFPYETITANPTATVSNVVPYGYKRAILKGQTLVNLVEDKTLTFSTGESSSFTNIVTEPDYISVETVTKLSTWTIITCDVRLPMLKPNTKYLVKFDEIKGHELYVSITKKDGTNPITNQQDVKTTSSYVILTTGSTINIDSQVLYFNIRNTTPVGTKIVVSKPRIIEYQEGMENWDIPYFEGMQSAKTPVLTTTGKNLFDKSKTLENCALEGTSNVVLKEWKNYFVSDYIPVKKNEPIFIPYTGSSRKIYCDKNKEYVHQIVNSDSYFTPEFDGFIRLTFLNVDLNTYQLEYNTQATSYEPFKSNILTVNEDVELRGIGEVKDELNCLTGEVIERISSFKPTNAWSITNELENTVLFTIKPPQDMDLSSTIISDKLPSVSPDDGGLWDTDIEGIGRVARGGLIRIRLAKTKASTLQEFQNYLQSNPITIQYELKTESIKTVDLTVTNQEGETLSKIKPIEGTMHIESSGTPIHPTAVLEVPVEAITQNLNSFIEEE